MRPFRWAAVVAGLVIAVAAGASCNAITGIDQNYNEVDCFPPGTCDATVVGAAGDSASDTAMGDLAKQPTDALREGGGPVAEGGGDAAGEAGPAAEGGETGSTEAGADADAEAGVRPEGGGCPSSDLVCGAGCVANDVHNCGVCGHDCTTLSHVSGAVTCTPSGACSFSASSCAPGWAHCSTDPNNGCETDITSPLHCGACGNACGTSAPVCTTSGSSYQCASGCSTLTLCGGTCVDTTSNPQDCKACGQACTTTVGHAQPTCVSSACSFACNSGYSPCGGACVNFASDNNNCNGCGLACTGGKQCVSGSCQCPTGENFCGNACVGSSLTACGASCTVCGPHQSCTGSGATAMCVCNHDPQCTVAGGACSGGALVTCALDSNNCLYAQPSQSCTNGACYGSAGSAKCCTNACSSSSCSGNAPVACSLNASTGCLVQTQGAPCAGATPTCSGGACICAKTACGSTCADTSTDTNNCGACGRVCSTNHVSGSSQCVLGVCKPPTCQTGYLSCNAPNSPAADDGCECAGTACCGTACQTQHTTGDNGNGAINGWDTTFYDCNPLVSAASAMTACNIVRSYLTNASEWSCLDNPFFNPGVAITGCTGEICEFDLYSPNNYSVGSCWGYSGTQAGGVFENFGSCSVNGSGSVGSGWH